MDKRSLIRRFTEEGYTLRPECLNHLTEYFSELKIQNNNKITPDVVNTHMSKILENVKSLQSHQGDIILGEQTVKGAIELLQRPSNQVMDLEEDTNKDKSSDDNTIIDDDREKKVNDVINEKYLHTIVVLDSMKETPKVRIHNNKPYTEFIINANTQEEKKQTISLGAPSDKVNFFIKRLEIIKTKLSQGKKYYFGAENKKKITGKNDLEDEEDQQQQMQSQELSHIGSLIGSKGKEMCCLGMIYEGTPGEYYMQDEFSRVKINLEQAQVELGYVTVTSIVIAKGVFDQIKGAFVISKLMLPEFEEEVNLNPSVYKKESSDYFGAKAKVQRILGKLIQLEIESAYLGKQGSKASNLTRFQKERQLEMGIFDLDFNPYFQISEKNEYCVCVFSDFLLSDRNTLKKFESILQVYESQLKPLVIILMGAFFNVSEINSEFANDQVKEAIGDFLNLLNKFKSLRDNCYWIMVPHINDIGGVPVQPKSELPQHLFTEIKSNIPFLKLVQNPCRMSILGKTFLIQRNDLLKDLRKRQIVINHHKDIQLNYAQTILSQRHLSPLPLIIKPIIWNYDNTLLFYENPDYLILADSYSDQFDFIMQEKVLTKEEQKSNIQKTFVINPGSFEKKSTFTVLYPLDGRIETCSV
ncbi:hypothetical protein ABPG72_012618 [Tetrahymena utriculariae]